MPAAYIPLLLFSLLVLSFPCIALIVFKFIRPSPSGGPAKSQPFESGMLPETSAHGRDSSRFCILAMLLVIFEAVFIFLFPWAVLFHAGIAAHHAALVLLPMLVFLGIVLVGYVWLYKKGALDVA
ncbi:MAG TPA: NADH-quinone oxidoreductase subunit A [Candidatus Acidoferrum sp.]|nr:NADH-quinone oxidoreductase subunit A [Candidatus Acidoferrum sp.]